MNIDFSKYAPTTVLRVRCRDGVEGYVHVGRPNLLYVPHHLVRDDEDTWSVHDDGRQDLDDYNLDVTAIIGEMVLRETA